jgi:hypothetical protein
VLLIITLLPAGRKFCKITQNRPKKENEWPGKLAAVQPPPILNKNGQKSGEKIFYAKHIFLQGMLSWKSNCQQISLTSIF